MKIVMATHFFASHNGGIEIVAGQLYHGLAREGQEVTWLAGDSTAPPEPVGVSRAVSLPVFNFVEVKTGLPFPIPTIGSLKRICSEVRNADVIVLHDCLYLGNIATFLFAKLRGIPIAVVQHIGLISFKNPGLRLLMKAANAIVTRPMLARAEQVVFISETTKNYFDSLNFRSAPEIIFNGVNTQVYRLPGPHETKSGQRYTFRLPENCPIVLYVGRFVEKKGISILKRMVDQRPNWVWVFAGWGPLDPESWNSLNVRVFSGLSGESLAALYRACDIFVIPSVGEGFPLVVQEALASGIPVVCGAETAAADEALRGIVRGVPIYFGDDCRTADEFLSVLDELLGSEATSASRRRERHAFAVSRYSWDRATERYIEIASRLVRQTPSLHAHSTIPTEPGEN